MDFKIITSNIKKAGPRFTARAAEKVRRLI